MQLRDVKEQWGANKDRFVHAVGQNQGKLRETDFRRRMEGEPTTKPQNKSYHVFYKHAQMFVTNHPRTIFRTWNDQLHLIEM